MLKVTVVIPTYNEAKNLEPLTEEIYSVIDKNNIDLEIIFVDDNSPDGTGDIAEKLKGRFPVKVIHRGGKLGLGSAVREGFKATDREVIGVMDADLSHDPKIINELVKSLQEFDISIGSRFEEGSSVENWKSYRKILSEVGVALARRITKCRDPLSGYFFFRKSVIDGVVLTTKGYKILLEILVKGKYKTIKEIPFNFRMRKFSTSKLNFKEYLLFLGQLIKYSVIKFL